MKTFIITRDRVSYAKRCLASIQRFPELEHIIVDHGSTYLPMLEWLTERTKHECVIFHGHHGPRDLWDILPTLLDPDERFIVTDCDIELNESTPDDWVRRLHQQLDTRQYVKAGLALKIDDLPRTILAKKVVAWENRFWENSLDDWGNLYEAPIDTTLAMYPPLNQQPMFQLGPAVRLGGAYTARHIPWYETEEDEELRYYREHALPGSSHWLNPEAWK